MGVCAEMHSFLRHSPPENPTPSRTDQAGRQHQIDVALASTQGHSLQLSVQGTGFDRRFLRHNMQDLIFNVQAVLTMEHRVKASQG